MDSEAGRAGAATGACGAGSAGNGAPVTAGQGAGAGRMDVGPGTEHAHTCGEGGGDGGGDGGDGGGDGGDGGGDGGDGGGDGGGGDERETRGGRQHGGSKNKHKARPAALVTHCPYEKMADRSACWGGIKLGSRTKWVITEKIHGANVCLVVSRDGAVHVAKRREFISSRDTFFGFRRAVKPLEDPARRVLQFLKSGHADVTLCWMCVWVVGGLLGWLFGGWKVCADACLLFTRNRFGELFGGKYPHDDVPRVDSIHPVQTGVWYSPDLHFAPFDVAWSRDDGATHKGASLVLFHARAHFSFLELCPKSRVESVTSCRVP